MKRLVLTIAILAALMMASSAAAVSVKSTNAAKTNDKAKQADTGKDRAVPQKAGKATAASKSSGRVKSRSGAIEKLNVLRRRVEASKSARRGTRQFDVFMDKNRDGVDDAARKSSTGTTLKKSHRAAAKPRSEPKKVTKKSRTPDNSTSRVKKKKP